VTPAAFNPLDLRHAGLRPESVLIARLLGLLVLLSGAAPFGRFLPYLPFLDALGSTEQFDFALRTLQRVGLVLVFFGPWTRPGCALVGAAILVGLVANRPAHSVAHTFLGYLFLLTGLSTQRSGTFLLRAQVVVLYAAAGLNKLVDPGWWDGGFVHTQLLVREHHPTYGQLAGLFPGRSLSAALGIATTLTEFAIAGCLAVRGLRFAGIALALVFHGSLLLVLGHTFGPFYGALLVAFLAFLPHPRAAVLPLPAWALTLLRATDPAREYRAERGSAGVKLLLDDGVVTGAPACLLLAAAHPLVAGVALPILTSPMGRGLPRGWATVALLVLALGWAGHRIVRLAAALRRARGDYPAPSPPPSAAA
jgi:hypothetical protein